MLKEKTIRKLLLTAVVMALATTPTGAETQEIYCWETPRHIGLFCNDGGLIRVCLHIDGTCTVDCGRGSVQASCGFPD